MAKKRNGLPTAWVTWLAPLLAGDTHCEWASWFRSNFYYGKVKDDAFDSAAWNATHTEMVHAQADALRAAGYTVRVEGENKFEVRGRTAAIAGKPDLVAWTDETILVRDCKGGKPRNAHIWQVAIYVRFLQGILGFPIPAGVRVVGEVAYADDTVTVGADEMVRLDAKARIDQALQNIGLHLAPSRTPSANECRFCDIPTSECPVRVAAEGRVTTTLDF